MVFLIILQSENALVARVILEFSKHADGSLLRVFVPHALQTAGGWYRAKTLTKSKTQK